ncbi:M1 family metallopeptidase [Streptomyces sp. NBC_00825]|uniref:M1 family metallopeptidase n=1 Tax=unclassified Streptomyces TaxID=2593676 RepID=UPI002253AB49|nr:MULTISPECIES: M1 family metallopeptidase [unclassified Streptomyces]WTB58376.1 M1 family metallopeptidase [Streptomyces sp. NBC_00826]WTH88744.1 M1 family metallopeptidase [Streptomyces sp. NBC_00825]WTH97474.1 M1 family metallopeptidase [Streptomyces sp. NBC_00822]MCX4862992.1 M1 family metallopeptidase [Streptomyces sp. NBC_00906]MCX4894229.1 M1 family metallopeptidase [Streptomyces sp. NBC_00892]
MHRRFIVPSAIAASLLLAIPASAAEGTVGAPGIGDPYYPASGNGGYDVSHYDLRLKYRPSTDLLEGTATILATTTQELTRFNLDFGLEVSEVRVNGKRAGHVKNGEQELEITPAAPLAKGRSVSVAVRYAGKPSEVKINGWTSWVRTPDGAVAAQEPESAAWWYPSNDHPLDKATYDISVSVPDGTQAISNGTLQSQSSKLGWTRFNWRSAQPQATYLTTLAVGKFDITTDTTSDGLPVVNAYSKDLGANAGAARASIERTTEVAEWLTGIFGPYPFDALGGYSPNVTSGFALETQTRPFYSPKQFANGSNVSVVVHELAHQWYGDSVSLKGWKDIWVNEGFARYSQWLWSEKEGEGTAQELADYTYALHPADDPFWEVKPGDPGPDNQFDAAVYDRGAMAIQALRNELGDETFFALLKGWPAEHAHGNASVSDFVTYAERVSGKPLAALFDAWLFRAERPAAPAAAGPHALHSAGQPARPASWKKIAATNSVHDHR